MIYDPCGGSGFRGFLLQSTAVLYYNISMLKKIPGIFFFFLIIAAAVNVSCTSDLKKPDIVSSLKNFNLIIINIDALRADHLGCYGYHRGTSPFIDSLAGNGMVFEKAMSNSSFTRESVSVLLSGRLPSSGGSVGWYAAPPGAVKNMGELFKDAGYKTGFFSNTNMLRSPGFTSGFDETRHLEEWGVSGNGPKLSRHTGEFIKKFRAHDKKFMIYVHYLDPHGPYKPPPKYYLRFAKKIYPKPLSLYKYVRKRCVSLEKKGFGPGDIRFEDMVLRYDAEIALIDRSIEILFNTLKDNNLLNNTLVVITSDHGEEFLEHHFVEHSWTLYNESLHIPLILWAPGALKPKRFTSLVSTVDILPTLLELMGIAHKRNDFDGTPLFRYKKKGFYFTPPDKPHISELLIQHRNLVRTVIKDNWKYIAAQKWLKPGERPNALHNIKEFEKNEKLHKDIWGPIIHEELYNLEEDPGEKHNIRDKKKRSQFRAIIKKYMMYCRQKGLKNIPGKQKDKPLSKEEIERLKSLGYL